MVGRSRGKVSINSKTEMSTFNRDVKELLSPARPLTMAGKPRDRTWPR